MRVSDSYTTARLKSLHWRVPLFWTLGAVVFDVRQRDLGEARDEGLVTKAFSNRKWDMKVTLQIHLQHEEKLEMWTSLRPGTGLILMIESILLYAAMPKIINPDTRGIACPDMIVYRKNLGVC